VIRLREFLSPAGTRIINSLSGRVKMSLIAKLFWPLVGAALAIALNWHLWTLVRDALNSLTFLQK
jgi:hypothetical protein